MAAAEPKLHFTFAFISRRQAYADVTFSPTLTSSLYRNTFVGILIIQRAGMGLEAEPRFTASSYLFHIFFHLLCTTKSDVPVTPPWRLNDVSYLIDKCTLYRLCTLCAAGKVSYAITSAYCTFNWQLMNISITNCRSGNVAFPYEGLEGPHIWRHSHVHKTWITSILRHSNKARVCTMLVFDQQFCLCFTHNNWQKSMMDYELWAESIICLVVRKQNTNWQAKASRFLVGNQIYSQSLLLILVRFATNGSRAKC